MDGNGPRVGSVKSAIAYEDIEIKKRRSIEGWNLPGYDCNNWKDVKAVNGPEGRLVNQKRRTLTG